MRTVTVYRWNEQTQTVEKEERTKGADKPERPTDFHENIIHTYKELEDTGQLGGMKAKEKTFLRDLHTMAQDPGYWHSNLYGYQGHGE